MSVRSTVLAVIAIVVAAVCIRLGFWQLDRHQQRSAYNERVTEGRSAAPVSLSELHPDTAARYRRVNASGVFDYEHEIVLAGRTRRGSPGVHVLTPLRQQGDPEARAILVNRGWLYSPDAATVDLSQWREGTAGDTVHVVGYLDALFSERLASATRLSGRTWHRLDPGTLAEAFPYELQPMQIVAEDVEPVGARVPVRIGAPAAESGPHLSYAFQWFAFATIALAGGAVLIVQDARRRR